MKTLKVISISDKDFKVYKTINCNRTWGEKLKPKVKSSIFDYNLVIFRANGNKNIEDDIISMGKPKDCMSWTM